MFKDIHVFLCCCIVYSPYIALQVCFEALSTNAHAVASICFCKVLTLASSCSRLCSNLHDQLQSKTAWTQIYLKILVWRFLSVSPTQLSTKSRKLVTVSPSRGEQIADSSCRSWYQSLCSSFIVNSTASSLVASSCSRYEGGGVLNTAKLLFGCPSLIRNRLVDRSMHKVHELVKCMEIKKTCRCN